MHDTPKFTRNRRCSIKLTHEGCQKQRDIVWPLEAFNLYLIMDDFAQFAIYPPSWQINIKIGQLMSLAGAFLHFEESDITFSATLA